MRLASHSRAPLSLASARGNQGKAYVHPLLSHVAPKPFVARSECVAICLLLQIGQNGRVKYDQGPFSRGPFRKDQQVIAQVARITKGSDSRATATAALRRSTINLPLA